MRNDPLTSNSASDSAPAEPLVSTLDDPGFADLVRCFVEELPGKIEKLERCLRDEDYQQLATLVHQLKGSAGGYGFRPITDAAAQLEKTVKEARHLEQLDSQLQELIGLCRRAVPAEQD